MCVMFQNTLNNQIDHVITKHDSYTLDSTKIYRRQLNNFKLSHNKHKLSSL
jgi:hypothetical protein